MTSPHPEFVVDLPLYSGPFRMLADLLLEQRMDVCDVPVARVTDRFLAWGMESLGGWPLDETTWFLSVCAVLLEIKVGRLLPRPLTASEEDLLGGASPDLVYARSLELAAFRMVAEDLAGRAAAAALSLGRSTGPPPEFAHLYPDVLEHVGPDDLFAAATRVLAPVPDLDLSHVTPIRATLADALASLQERLVLRPESRFRDLLDDCQERIHVVIRFLAILELYREGKVELSQAGVFGDIEVRWQGSTLAARPSDERQGASE